jgi:hypothetical protein
MTKELKMPKTAEEGMEEELRVVVMNLSLPKAIWWSLDQTEKNTGNSTSDELAFFLKRSLLLSFLRVLLEDKK